MAVAQRMSEEQYQQFVLSGAGRAMGAARWAVGGEAGVTWEHADIAMELAYLLRIQLNRDEYRVFVESRVRRPAATVFMPDSWSCPTAYGEPFRGRPVRWRSFPIRCRSSSRSGHLDGRLRRRRQAARLSTAR